MSFCKVMLLWSKSSPPSACGLCDKEQFSVTTLLSSMEVRRLKLGTRFDMNNLGPAPHFWGTSHNITSSYHAYFTRRLTRPIIGKLLRSPGSKAWKEWKLLATNERYVTRKLCLTEGM
jgi:hypothetical protein